MGNYASYHTAFWLTRTAHYWRFANFSRTDLPLFRRQAWIIWGKGNSVSEGIRWPPLSFKHLSPLPVLLHSLVWNDNCSFLRGKAEQYVHRCKREFGYSSESIRAFGSRLKWCHTTLFALHFSALCVCACVCVCVACWDRCHWKTSPVATLKITQRDVKSEFIAAF